MVCGHPGSLSDISPLSQSNGYGFLILNKIEFVISDLFKLATRQFNVQLVLKEQPFLLLDVTLVLEFLTQKACQSLKHQ